MTLELAGALASLPDTSVEVEAAASNELLGPLLGLGVPVGVDRVHPSLRTPWWSAWRIIPGPWSIGGRARRRRIHAVVSVMDHPLSGLGALCLRLARVPLVLVVHDGRPHVGERKRLLELSGRMSMRLATRLVVLSTFVRDQLGARGVDPSRIAVIPHGPFYAGETARPTGPTSVTRVLFFGRIVEYKGVDLLLAAWPEVVEQVPDAQLDIVGEGDIETLRELYEALPSVHVRNSWVPDRDVPAIVGAADLVVLPYREASQSGVIGIARSLGVPVLVTDVGGLSEQVDDGVDGMVCAPEVGSIAAAIVRYLTSPSLRAELAVGSRDDESWAEVARMFRSEVASLHDVRWRDAPT